MIVNRTVELKLRSERRAGELLSPVKGRPGKGNAPLPLSEIGITKIQSHRWQSIAAIAKTAEGVQFLAHHQTQVIGTDLNMVADLPPCGEIAKQGKPPKSGGLETLETLGINDRRLAEAKVESLIRINELSWKQLTARRTVARIAASNPLGGKRNRPAHTTPADS